jgi:ABC-type lipoprotein release transport system permease subunit
MIVKRGMVLAALGLVIGLVAAAALTRSMSGLLYGVTQYDAVAFATGPALLAAVALLACVIPAMRAASVDPLVALREE